MRIAEMNWMQVEQHVTRDRRAVLPLGSTEQHGQLSLCVDAILAERVSVEAAAAARRTGVSGDQLRADAQLRRLRRHGDVAALDAVRAGLRRARRHGPREASGRSSSSMATAATRRPMARCSSGSTAIAACR